MWDDSAHLHSPTLKSSTSNNSFWGKTSACNPLGKSSAEETASSESDHSYPKEIPSFFFPVKKPIAGHKFSSKESY